MEKRVAELEQQVEDLLQQAEQVYENEDAKYRKGKRGNDLPEELKFKQSRLQKIQEAKKALEEEAKEQLAIILDSDEGYGTIAWLYRKYIASEHFMSLTTTSQKSYEGRLKRLIKFPLKREDGSDAIVGDIPLSWLTRPKAKKLHSRILKSYTELGFERSK